MGNNLEAEKNNLEAHCELRKNSDPESEHEKRFPDEEAITNIPYLARSIESNAYVRTEI